MSPANRVAALLILMSLWVGCGKGVESTRTVSAASAEPVSAAGGYRPGALEAASDWNADEPTALDFAMLALVGPDAFRAAARRGLAASCSSAVQDCLRERLSDLAEGARSRGEEQLHEILLSLAEQGPLLGHLRPLFEEGGHQATLASYLGVTAAVRAAGAVASADPSSAALLFSRAMPSPCDAAEVSLQDRSSREAWLRERDCALPCIQAAGSACSSYFPELRPADRTLLSGRPLIAYAIETMALLQRFVAHLATSQDRLAVTVREAGMLRGAQADLDRLRLPLPIRADFAGDGYPVQRPVQVGSLAGLDGLDAPETYLAVGADGRAVYGRSPSLAWQSDGPALVDLPTDGQQADLRLENDEVDAARVRGILDEIAPIREVAGDRWRSTFALYLDAAFSSEAAVGLLNAVANADHAPAIHWVVRDENGRSRIVPIPPGHQLERGTPLETLARELAQL